MKSNLFSFLLIFLISALSSCRLFDKFIDEKNKAKTIYEALDKEKKEIYSKVKDVQKSSTIPADKLEALKKEYKEVQDAYNSTFDKIDKSIDSDQLDSQIIKKGTCLIGGYQLLLNPFQSDLEQASKKGTTFLTNADKALSSPPNAGASVGGFWSGLILPVITTVINKRVGVCRDNIKKMKYETWDNIK